MTMRPDGNDALPAGAVTGFGFGFAVMADGNRSTPPPDTCTAS